MTGNAKRRDDRCRRMMDEPWLYQQDQVEAICRTPEKARQQHHILVNTPACFYGTGDILRRYAGLERPMQTPFSVEHFISYFPNRPVKFDMERGYRTLLTTTRERANAYLSEGAPRVLPVGFAMHYAIRLFERLHGPLTAPEKRRGTLVFPHKSAGVMRDRSFDHTALIKWLLALPEAYQPVYVCLYWKDQQKGDAQPFEEAGLPVVSCGHWLHEDFLLRLVDLCRRFRYSCANAFGGSFPQSVLCGCQFIYKETGGFTEHAEGRSVHYQEDPLKATRDAQLALPLCPFPPLPEGRPAQLSLVREMSGHSHVRSAWRMRWLFWRESRHLSRHRPDTMDFESGAVTWNELRPWQSEGLELDGWLHPEVVLLAPRNRRETLLTLLLELPGWADLAVQKLEVTLPTGERREFGFAPGRQVLTVQMAPQRKDSKLKLRFAHSFPMPAQERLSCSRLLRLTHATNETGTEQVILCAG